MREYALAYFSYIDNLKLYTDEERGRLFMAMLEYARDGIEPSFTGKREEFLWVTMKQNIDRSSSKYEEMCAKNRENGKKSHQKSDGEKTEENKPKSRFVPPDRDTVEAFFIEAGSDAREAEGFYLFYDSKGWKVGSASMKRWESAALRWIRNNERKAGAGNDYFGDAV